MLLADKIALEPNDKQATYFAKATAAARFADHWALAEGRREYKEGGSLRK
jgi:putative transposase